MRLVYTESFELYRTGPVAGFLAEAGLRLEGRASVIADRSGRAQALSLNGRLGYSVSTLRPVVTFGFAGRTSATMSLLLPGGVALRVGATVTLAGKPVTQAPQPSVWNYFELTIDKGEGEIALAINGAEALRASLPSSLRFVTTYLVQIEGQGDLDDLAVVEDGRTGPIGSRAHYQEGLTPWEGDEAGRGISAQADPRWDEDTVACAVAARLSVDDLDGRRVRLNLGERTVSVLPELKPRYAKALFNEKPGGRKFGLALAGRETS